MDLSHRLKKDLGIKNEGLGETEACRFLNPCSNREEIQCVYLLLQQYLCSGRISELREDKELVHPKFMQYGETSYGGENDVGRA